MLVDISESASESPDVLEVPRVLEDDARESGRGRVTECPEAKDRYVEDNRLTKPCTPVAGAGAEAGALGGTAS